MLANVSTPLLGLVDTAVVGRLGGPEPIGAVSVGALVFTFVFWGFGFLRLATSGLAAQALGAGDRSAVAGHLVQGLALAGALGLALIALQAPIGQLALALIAPPEAVAPMAASYIAIRFWAAPATLANYALSGWLVGLGQTRRALVVQLALGLSNMALDALLALGLGMGVDGVALGTVLAQWLAVGVGLGLARPLLPGGRLPRVAWGTLRRGLGRTIAVNADLMIRTVSLITVFGWFTAQGARQGAVVLAANTVLMQLVGTSVHVLDGVANAVEALAGRAFGARDPAAMRRVLQVAGSQSLAFAALLSLVMALAGGPVIGWLTDDPATREAALEALGWAAGVPVIGVAAFLLDGLFIGTTRSRAMRDAMLVSLGIFLVAWWLLRPFGNHGLWGAMVVHYGARTLTLLVGVPALWRAATASRRQS